MYTIAQVADGSTEPSSRDFELSRDAQAEGLTEVGEHWRDRLRALPLLVLLGMGLALSNTRAVLKAILGLRQGFQRTPKFALRRRGDTWVGSVYALSGDALIWGEVGFAIFALALLAAPGVRWGFVPWLLLYAGGFGYVAGVSLRQAYQRRRWLAMQTRPAASKVEHIPQGGPDRIRAGWPGRDR